MSAHRWLLCLIAATGAWGAPARADNDPQKSPEYCGACHRRIYQEWKSSPMGSDLANPIVRQLYLGLNARNEPDGFGYRGIFPDRKGDCADCHVPTLVIDEHKAGRGDVDLAAAIDRKLDHGISCQFCHTVGDVHIRRGADGRYERRIFERVQLENGERKFGPRLSRKKGPESPAHETVASPLLKDSKLCGTCHLNQEEKVLAISTYQDWKALYDAGATNETCQSCHMPLHSAPVEVADGFPLRTGVRSHAFPGARDPAMLHKAVDLKLDARIEGGQLVVTTRVENVGAAHPVPGSGPIRNVILKIDATDGNGHPLAFVGDAQLLLPPLAGIGNPQTKERDAQDWAGSPGRFYAKVLKGVNPKTGQAQLGVPGFVADGIAFDTTLKPGKPDVAEFRFALPGSREGARFVDVKARLVYRWAFKPMADRKSWKIDDRPMREQSLRVSLPGGGVAAR